MGTSEVIECVSWRILSSSSAYKHLAPVRRRERDPLEPPTRRPRTVAAADQQPVLQHDARERSGLAEANGDAAEDEESAHATPRDLRSDS